MGTVRKAARVVELIEKTVLSLLFLTLLGLASTQIVLRNFFDSGLVWADEAIKVLVLWLAMAGALYATKEAKHINIDIITRFLPGRIANWIYRLAYFTTALLCFAVAYYSYQFVLLEYEMPMEAFLGIPTWVCQAVIPVAFALMGLRFLVLVGRIPLLYVAQTAAHTHADM